MVKKALCIISGGMDSTLCAYLAKQEGYEIIALHFDYKQRTQRKERECFEQICKLLEVKKSYIFDLSFIASIGGNALTDKSIAIPKNELNAHMPPITYVPFRNGIFLSIAASLAEREDCQSIFIGVVQEDGSTYPDCSEKFLLRAQEFIDEGTSKHFKSSLKTPLIGLNKSQIVKLALEQKVPLEFTWSCYENEDEACGQCKSCLLRLRAFKKAGFKDKIQYKI